MDKKPKRRTRERILETALQLFNDLGEANVAAALIADRMVISPGNLYYHFDNKQEIVVALFLEFKQAMDSLTTLPEERLLGTDDFWLYLHLLFETIWKYRFIYRSLNDLITHNRLIETHFQRLLEHQEATLTRLCQGLVDSGALKATSAQSRALAVNLNLAITFWLSFEQARHPRAQPDIGQGVYQTMSLVAPFLTGRARQLLEELSQNYLGRGSIT